MAGTYACESKDRFMAFTRSAGAGTEKKNYYIKIESGSIIFGGPGGWGGGICILKVLPVIRFNKKQSYYFN